MIIFGTIESGAARESYNGHSILDIAAGKVTSLEREGRKKPGLSRNLGMLLGFMATVGGIAQYLDRNSKVPFSGMYLILFGLALFAVSLISLNGKRTGKRGG